MKVSILGSFLFDVMSDLRSVFPELIEDVMLRDVDIPADMKLTGVTLHK